jgi:hypothetical protein
MRKPRNVVSRLEDPNYGKFTLATLLEVAAAFGVGLLVKFVPFSRLVREYEDVSPAGLSARGITSTEEAAALSEWAKEADVDTALENTPSANKVIVLSEYAFDRGAFSHNIATSAGPVSTSGPAEPLQQPLFLDKPRTGRRSRKRRSRTESQQQGKKFTRQEPAPEAIKYAPPSGEATSAYRIELAS